MHLKYYTIKNSQIIEISEETFLNKIKNKSKKQEYINYKKVTQILEDNDWAEMELLINKNSQIFAVGYTIDTKQIDNNKNVEIIIPQFVDSIVGFFDRVFYYGPEDRIETVTVQQANPVYIEFGSLRDELHEQDMTDAAYEAYITNTVVDMRQLDIAGYKITDSLNIYNNQEMLLQQKNWESERRKVIYPYDLKLTSITEDESAKRLVNSILGQAFKICNITNWNDTSIEDITKDSRYCQIYMNSESINLERLSNISRLFQNNQIWLDQPGIDDPSGTGLEFDIDKFNFRNIEDMTCAFANIMFQDYSNRHKLNIHWNMGKSLSKNVLSISEIFSRLNYKEISIELEVGDMAGIETKSWFKGQKKLGTVKIIGDNIDILNILADSSSKIKTLDLSEATIDMEDQTLSNVLSMLQQISLINTIIVNGKQIDNPGGNRILNQLYRLQAAALVGNIKIKD